MVTYSECIDAGRLDVEMYLCTSSRSGNSMDATRNSHTECGPALVG